MRKYQPKEFEQKHYKQWEQNKVYSVTNPQDKKNKIYTLVMFPYPSGAGLHVGHVRIYTGGDVLARYFRMKGNDVLNPIGFDAFGLPAENAAIKSKQNPMDMVPQNIANFTRQMKMMGLSYDWNRSFATTDPKYYGITQELFLKFFKLGLLYKKMTPVFFCPFCKTGLSEEEVLPNGTHERCGKTIEKRDLPQWIFKITSYAQSLMDSLNQLEWPDGIVQMQKNWIGKKEGIEITYQIKGTDETIICFTTRPETNFGATFVVLAPEHPFVKKIVNGVVKTNSKAKEEVSEYVKQTMSKTDIERQLEGRKKTGAFTGLYVVNKLNGRELPIWVSDFVLASFGTGAVVGVPAHDERDFEFASTFDIPVVRVIASKDGDSSEIKAKDQVYEDEGTIINSDFLNGLTVNEAAKKITAYLQEKGWGKKVVSYHLRDWIFSRQRYWGEPIPMVYCEKCAQKGLSYWDTKDGEAFYKRYQNISKVNKDTQIMMEGWFPIDQKNLPLELPYMKYYEPTGTGESPLATATEWLKATCPNCGGEARRETDTMPNWAGSCWYFLAFTFWDNEKKEFSFDDEAVKKWMPVDWYIGGAEHAVLHLLYARFWMHILNDMGEVGFREPFKRLRNVGMVLAEDHKKMSKSLGNTINPDDVVAEYGADAVRVYEMFMAPFNQEIAWSTSSLQGAYRFLNRIWNLYHNTTSIDQDSDKEDKRVAAKLQRTIEKVGRDITDVKFNTAIASMMEFLNEWEKGEKKLSVTNAKKFLQLLAPFAPYMTEEIWQTVFNEKSSIHVSLWPEVDQSAILVEDVQIPVQINGKARGVISVPASNIDQETVVKTALADERYKKFIEGKEYKVIYVKGKILNFVVKN